jgi:hypothetical protein
MSMNVRRVATVAAMCLAVLTLLVRSATGCSAFVVSEGQVVLFGNNEDFWNPATRMWVVPAGEERYGRLYFGYDDLIPQGGMNEAGLVYDGFAKKPRPAGTSDIRPKFEGNLIDHAMATCGTVADVIELFQRHDLAMMEGYNLMFADAGGDAVVIEADSFIRKQGKLQVVTNFDLSRYPDGVDAYDKGQSCLRFQIAKQMLADMGSPTIEKARCVLAAVHAEGRSRTLYSNIYDLKRRLVYVYLYHDFANEVVVDLASELRKGRHFVKLPALFPRNFAYETFVQEQNDELEKRRSERAKLAVAPELLGRYAGRYLGPDGVLTVSLDGAALYAEYAAFERAALTPASETEFFVLRPTYDIDLAFVVDGSGAVTGLRIRTGEQGATFPRLP